MNKSHTIGKLIFVLLLLAISFATGVGQETKKYANAGVTFECLPGWELTEQTTQDSQQISLSNKDSDSQILLIVLRKQTNSKDPMTDLKKQTIDPWVSKLVAQYTQAGIKVVQQSANIEVAGQQADGTMLKFSLDEQPGRGEAYWILLEKRLVLLYFIRPDKTVEKAVPGWDSIRRTLKVEAVK